MKAVGSNVGLGRAVEKEEDMKTLGQIAHDTGAKEGRWLRRWEDMTLAQRAEWETLAKAVAEIEREACAKVCETHTVDDVLVGVGIAKSCAAMIRARSN